MIETNKFKWKRWTNISLRTLHLIGIAGIGGAFLYQASEASWRPYLILTIVSGFGMILNEAWKNPVWFIQLRGVATLFKLMILLSVFYLGLQAYILITVIVISSVMAHAPGDLRYFSIVHWRRYP